MPSDTSGSGSAPPRTSGLNAAEVEARRRQFGFNEVAERKPSSLARLAGKFWSLSAWMLELIAVLSWWFGRYADLTVAALLLVLNAIVSFTQERRAEGVVEALRQRLTVAARVLRDGRWDVVPARELVPDDVVRLRQGDLVPADVHVEEGAVSVDQSMLTGESREAHRTPGSTLYSGSIVRRGEATGVVTLTGARTYFGKTVELVQIARPRLHVEEIVAKIVRWLFLIVGGMLVMLVAVALARAVPLSDLLPLSLALLLGAVPVALPVMFTVSMAVGARELAKHGVLVTRLTAVEDAAAMDVLCVDKTGTITQNRLTVAGVFPNPGFETRDVLRAAAFASQEADRDPIDLAVLSAARDAHALDDASVRTIEFVPFDAARRRTEATVIADGQRLVAIKGAVDTVASLCHASQPATADLDRRAGEEAQRGYRMLAVARASGGAEPVLVGLLTLQDPPRSDAASLIDTLRAAGVSVKMLTGDALPVATELARRVGLSNVQSVTAADRDAALDQAAVDASVGGLAAVFPQDKYRVVRALQAAGHVSGMTGDGVNDAPALRQAEVGIAVSAATDVAKGAAGVVLTTEGLSGIVTLVREGRIVSQRILTWIINKVSRTVLKSAFVAIAFLVTGRFVISALGMILVVFLTDFAKIALATDRARGTPRPESWDLKIPVTVGALIGVLLLVEALLALWIAWARFGLGANEQSLQTFGFQLLFYFALFSIVSARERRRFWASRPSSVLTATLLIDGAVGTILCLVGIPGLRPVPAQVTVFAVAMAVVSTLVINDRVKSALFRRAAGAP